MPEFYHGTPLPEHAGVFEDAKKAIAAAEVRRRMAHAAVGITKDTCVPFFLACASFEHLTIETPPIRSNTLLSLAMTPR